MQYVLIVEAGARPGLKLLLREQGRQVIGRSENADLVLPAEDRSVSRWHAQLDMHPDGVQVRALQGTGATLINGAWLEGSARLVPGDTIQLGDVLLRLEVERSRSLADVEEEPLSVRDIVESVRSLRPHRSARTALLVAPQTAKPVMVTGAGILEGGESEVLTCTGCQARGIAPPRPDLWDAAWLCARCAGERRGSAPGLPTRIGGFDVLRQLALGGMGVVFEAVERSTGLHVAIKLLQAGLGERSLQRFLREQQITKALRHPNIACCYDVGVWQDQPYIANEFVAGGDGLRFASKQSSIQDVLWLGADLFRALGYAHDLGVVHRDVKPANVLLARTGPRGTLRAKLTDFGLAKSHGDLGTRRITASHESGGSLLTSSPEQIQDFINVGPDGDIYSAAATVFWLLTKDTPLVLPVPPKQASFEQKALAIISTERKSLQHARPEVPRALGELIDNLVAHEPSARMQMRARDVAVALSAIAARLGSGPSMARRVIVQPVGAQLGQHATDRPPADTTVELHAPPSRPARAATDSAGLHEAMGALEACVRMLERHVEQASAEVREAVGLQDAPRLDRASRVHEQVQADLETALARWERIVAKARRPALGPNGQSGACEATGTN